MTEVRKSAAAYLVTVGLCLASFAWVTEAWKARLSVPLVYGGDALLTQLWVKSVVENGWYLTNRSVGAPFGLEMHDFPLADGLFFLILKVLSWGMPGYARVYNVYHVLTFPLAAVSALFVFRRFGVPRAPAVVAGVLFGFLPYHFLRGQEHLFLASYFLVPLAVMAVLRLYLEGGPPFSGGDGGWSGVSFGAPGTLAVVVIDVLLGCGGVYYAFFSCYFFLVSGASAALWRRRAYPLWSAGFSVALVSLGVLVNVAPKFVYEWRHGPNPGAVVRDPAHAELFGLKLAQMLLPVSGHRVAALARVKARYDEALAPLVNENASSALGAVGAAGFLALTAGLLGRRPAGAPRVWDGLVVSNLAAVLLATFGGFGTLFGFLVSPWIRGYNRMSVFIAFFALFAAALALARVDHLARTRRARRLFHAGLGLLLVGGVLDQTSRSFVPDYAGVSAAFEGDAEFVGRLEASLPPRAMVFQLPYSPYPEPTNVHRMQWYDHLRGYLHSRSLRWSYGAMRGRYGDLWQAHAAAEPTGAMLRRLALAGFGGVYLDRAGFVDRGTGLEAELARRLGVEPLVSRDRRFSFFGLDGYAGSLRRGLTADEWAARREAALSPVLAGWGGGFYGPEAVGDGNRRWSDGFGEITLNNPSAVPRRVELTMTLATKAEEPSWVHVKGVGGKADYRVDGAGRVVRRAADVPPGTSRLKLVGNGRKVKPPGDPRTLVFRVDGFTVTEPGGRGPVDIAGGPATAARRSDERGSRGGFR